MLIGSKGWLGIWSILVLVASGEWCWYGSEGCLHPEREALLMIKDDINRPNGSSLPDWKGQDCCTWKGVTCDNSSTVLEIDISSVRSEKLGTWYPNTTLFLQFKKLSSLQLGNNQIGGWTRPEGLCEMTNLQILEISKNRLENDMLPPCLGNLSNLQSLDLSQNNLKGHFLTSTGFCELKSLRIMHLETNAIEGRIPPCISYMNSLEELYLSKNQLSGSIPPLVNLTSLRNIFLDSNNLDGAFEFFTIANLSALQMVDLSNNPLLQVETESPTWIPSFQLQYICLSSCRLNKLSDSAMPTFLPTQSNLYLLDLSGNDIVGNIPSWMLYNMTKLQYLTLAHNSIAGSFPLPSKQTINNSILWLDVSENYVQGPLPSNINILFPKLLYLNISTNVLQGEIFFDSTKASSLQVLDLSSNYISGEIPNGLLGKNSSITYLGLSNNRLHGGIMPRDSSMTQLQHLILDGNDLTGRIPDGLSSSTNLQCLNLRGNFLSGSIPSWLPRLGNLALLLLGGNDFSGFIPIELCQMQNIHLLDFSKNHLSGNIPPCLKNVSAWISRKTSVDAYLRPLGNAYKVLSLRTDFATKGRSWSYEGIPLSLMTGIDLSSNQLTGNIPPETGYLREIRSLNLSHNLLMGNLPESFQYLLNLESLDLSHNKFTGRIPTQLGQVHALSTFSVAFNNLSGAIPDFQGQFSTFTVSSYMGNPDLCGQPLERNCSLNGPPQSHVEDGGDKDESSIVDQPMFFYSCVAISYVLGFWGFIGSLFFNEGWRKKFFEIADWCLLR